MDMFTIALFGEAEKGAFHTPILCHDIIQLERAVGNPPPLSRGIPYAIQTLLHQMDVMFFRVEAEGYSIEDYTEGMRLLAACGRDQHVTAICLPGVGDPSLFQMITPVCLALNSLLITTESDLYDYLTSTI